MLLDCVLLYSGYAYGVRKTYSVSRIQCYYCMDEHRHSSVSYKFTAIQSIIVFGSSWVTATLPQLEHTILFHLHKQNGPPFHSMSYKRVNVAYTKLTFVWQYVTGWRR